MTSLSGVHYLEHDSVELFGYKIFGTPYVCPGLNWAFMLNDEERKTKFTEIPTHTDLLITHSPPAGILDATDTDSDDPDD